MIFLFIISIGFNILFLIFIIKMYRKNKKDNARVMTMLYDQGQEIKKNYKLIYISSQGKKKFIDAIASDRRFLGLKMEDKNKNRKR